MMTAGWLAELCVPPPPTHHPQYPPPQEEIASSRRHACHPAMRERWPLVFVRARTLSDDKLAARCQADTHFGLNSGPAETDGAPFLPSRDSALPVIGRLPVAGLVLPVLCPTASSESEEEKQHGGCRKTKQITNKSFV